MSPFTCYVLAYGPDNAYTMTGKCIFEMEVGLNINTIKTMNMINFVINF